MKNRSLKIFKTLNKKRILLGEPLAKHTTFRVGGPADWFYEAKSSAEIVRAVKLARRENLPYLLLGGGSNLLVSDRGFRGLVIKVANQKFKFYKEKNGYRLTVGAGMPLGDLVNLCLKKKLAGAEFLVGIPGTVGGAVRGNAGAWQKETSGLVTKVRILDNQNEIRWVPKNDGAFGYRQSRFKRRGEVILEATLFLKKGDRKRIQKQIELFREKRMEQPKEPSAGCVFVNPKPQAAGALIDQLGLKGKKIGEAQISPKHANFIVNLGKAKAKDIKSLINLAQTKVKEKFGVDLKLEIQLVGFAPLDKAG